MKPVTFLLVLALVVALAGQVAAQPVERVAFTYCDDYSYIWAWCGIVVMDTDGSNAEIIRDAIDPVWSADGSRLMFHWNEVFVLDLASRTTVTLPTAGWSPALSPDGSNVVVGVEDLYVTKADGTGVPVNLTNHAALAPASGVSRTPRASRSMNGSPGRPMAVGSRSRVSSTPGRPARSMRTAPARPSRWGRREAEAPRDHRMARASRSSARTATSSPS